MKLIKQDKDFIEYELLTEDKEQRLGVLLDRNDTDSIQIYYKGYNQNAEIWERRMHSIDVSLGSLTRVMHAAKESILLDSRLKKEGK